MIDKGINTIKELKASKAIKANITFIKAARIKILLVLTPLD